MSQYLQTESAGVLPEWRAYFTRAMHTVRSFFERRRQRQELLDYLGADHRAAADLGVSGNDAREWAARPFWRS